MTRFTTMTRFDWRPAVFAAAFVLTGVLTGCGSQPATDVGEPPAAADTPPVQGARTLPIPGAPGAAATEQAGRGTLLVWDAPEGWVARPPQSSMRLAQYAVPGPGGEATCVVYYFGPGQGGDPMSNALRWAGQFEQPDGVASSERMTVETVEGAAMPARIVAVRGTYNGGMTMTDQPSPSVPDAMLIGGIAEGPDAPWFFKLTGPAATVESQRESMIALLRSLRPAPTRG